jgi:TIR domain
VSAYTNPMERGERLALIKKLGRRLEDESYTDLGLTLRTYEFSSPGYDPEYQATYDYVVERLEQGSDPQLGELHRHLFPDNGELSSLEGEEANAWSAGNFRLFVSHHTSFRAPASRLSAQLRPWGVDAFVAHEAIEPTRKWQEEIQSALRTCDALLALLTPEFVGSRWCDQEVGFAVARRLLIVPVKVGVDPHGFMGQYQAIPVSPEPNSSSPYKVANAVFDALARNPKTVSAMAPAIARRFATSDSYQNTIDVFPLLETINSGAWTAQMAEEVKKAGEINSQVRDAVLPGGRAVPSAAEELIAGMSDLVFATSAPAVLAGDDDIPF